MRTVRFSTPFHTFSVSSIPFVTHFNIKIRNYATAIREIWYEKRANGGNATMVLIIVKNKAVTKSAI